MISTVGTDPDLTATAATVGAVWAELLKLEAVAPDDDFFELGGHSLNAAAAVARVSARIGIDLPLLAIFEAPTPAEMAELIAELREEQRSQRSGVTPFLPSWVVPLQREGDGRPVFVFPAGHDESLALALEARLAVHVGRDRPFWGFSRDRLLSETNELGGFAAMCAAYAAQMTAIQGGGPFLLAANCAGGPYAWETAAQLLAAGHSIAGMLFFEVPLEPGRVAAPRDFTPVDEVPEALTADSYLPRPLPIALTSIETAFWHQRRWGDAWHPLALDGVTTVVVPDEAVASRETRDAEISARIREWIERTEARLPAR